MWPMNANGRTTLLARIILTILLMSVPAVPNAAVDQQAMSKPDEVKNLIGKWALIAAIIDGVDISEGSVTQGGEVTVYTFRADNTFTINRGSKTIEEGTWTADTSTSPKQFDHMPTHGNLKYNGTKSIGIYESNGEILKFCVTLPDRPRPPRFRARPGTGDQIYIMKLIPE